MVSMVLKFIADILKNVSVSPAEVFDVFQSDSISPANISDFLQRLTSVWKSGKFFADSCLYVRITGRYFYV